MRILSIDYDYYQIVDVDTVRKYYPDGIDISTRLSSAVWAVRYADVNAKSAIASVKINSDEIEATKQLLMEQCSDCPVLISNTHKDIYDFAVAMMSNSGSSELQVTNVDMHHDMFNDNPELDCGNWVSFLQQKYADKMSIRWIANPISKIAYGFSDEDWKYIGNSVTKTQYREYDAIFLCRSDAWLPPHLDQSFNDMIEFIKGQFINVQIKPCVAMTREYKEMAQEIAKMSKAITSTNDKTKAKKTPIELD